MSVENGILAKLGEIRHKFIADFEDAAKRFDEEVRGLREAYLAELVDVALMDPRLADVQRALAFRVPAAVAASTLAPSLATEGLVPLPEKWPMRARKRICPTCSTPCDPRDRFCSQCAYPLTP